MPNSSKNLKKSIENTYKKTWIKKAFSVFVSLTIITVIYSKIDISSFLLNLRGSNTLYFSFFFLLFLPIFTITALRWHLITSSVYKVNFSENFMIYMACKPMNLLFPSKMGEMTKAFFIVKRDLAGVTDAVDIVAIEKMCDILTLCLLLIISTFIFGKYTTLNIIINLIATIFIFSYLLIVALNSFFKGFYKFTYYLNKIPLGAATLKKLKYEKKLMIIVLLSLFAWFLHLTQFFFLFRTMNSLLEIGSIYTLIPIAIFAGLAPFTVAGIGTRDAALLAIFSGMETTAVLLAVGALSSLRYFIPSLLGLPFFYSLSKR